MNQQWIYFRIALGKHYQCADTIIIKYFSALKADDRIQQWFYLRYYEKDIGFHLRFRVKVNNQDAEAVKTTIANQLDIVIEQGPQLPKVVRAPLFNQGFDYQYDDKPLQVIDSIYEPELDKFGGEVGLEIAESWFAPSSDLAIDILQHEIFNQVPRHIVVNHLTRVVCESFNVKPNIAKFLQIYAGSWLPHNLVQSNSFRNKFFAQAIDMLDNEQPLLSPEYELDEIQLAQIQRWQKVAEQTAAKLRRAGFNQVFLDSQAWQLIHLMNNRLGFSPLDEAYLATILEAWYREEARNAA